METTSGEKLNELAEVEGVTDTGSASVCSNTAPIPD
jgi:hypothetical protein